VGVSFLDIYNTAMPFLAEIIRSLSRTAEELGLNLQVFPIPAGRIRENSAFLEDIRRREIEGLILTRRVPAEDIVFLQKEGLPFVWIANDLPGEENLHSVLASRMKSLALVLEHLTRLGHHRISLLTTETSSALEEEFLTLCSAKGVKGRYVMRIGAERQTGYVMTEEVIRKERPDVLITRGLDLTLSALECLSEAGLSVPEDIALVGMSVTLSYLPGSTTVWYSPLAEMARRALIMLDRLLSGEKVEEKREVLKESLIIRGSCGYLAGKNGQIVVAEIEELDNLTYKRQGGG